MGDNFKWVLLWVLVMLRRFHTWFPGAGQVFLGIIGSDDKKYLSLAEMLVNMHWGASGAIGLMCCHQCFIVICSRILDCLLLWSGWWRGKIHNTLLGPDSLQWFYPCFYLLWICACQSRLCIHCHIIVQLIWDWSGSCRRFLHVLLVLINYTVGFGLGAWMKLWLRWGDSNWLSFLMTPLCEIFLSGNPDSFLCIPSRLLYHLSVVVVGFKYY